MNKKKSLQKFTETEAKVNNILSLEQVTFKDIDNLNDVERRRLLEIINEKCNKLKGTERDKFYYKIEPITNNIVKNQLWENNHNQITWAISTLMQENGRMPSKTDIANKTELSRQTVHKHLKEYVNHPLYLEEIEQFRFMTSKVLARVFKFAVNGDMGAAKLYLNATGLLNKGHTSIKNQTNNIQINGITISQDAIKNLTVEQLKIVEGIFKDAVEEVY